LIVPVNTTVQNSQVLIKELLSLNVFQTKVNGRFLLPVADTAHGVIQAGKTSVIVIKPLPLFAPVKVIP
jgi:hypothetical protein